MLGIILQNKKIKLRTFEIALFVLFTKLFLNGLTGKECSIECGILVSLADRLIISTSTRKFIISVLIPKRYVLG